MEGVDDELDIVDPHRYPLRNLFVAKLQAAPQGSQEVARVVIRYDELRFLQPQVHTQSQSITGHTFVLNTKHVKRCFAKGCGGLLTYTDNVTKLHHEARLHTPVDVGSLKSALGISHNCRLLMLW